MSPVEFIFRVYEIIGADSGPEQFCLIEQLVEDLGLKDEEKKPPPGTEWW